MCDWKKEDNIFLVKIYLISSLSARDKQIQLQFINVTYFSQGIV